MTDATFYETDIIAAFLEKNTHLIQQLDNIISIREKTHGLWQISTDVLKASLTAELDRLDKLAEERKQEILMAYVMFRNTRLLEFMQKLVLQEQQKSERA